MSSFRGAFASGEDNVQVTLRHVSKAEYQVQVGDELHRVEAIVLPDGRVRCTTNGQTFEVDGASCGKSFQVRLAGHTWTLAPPHRRGEAASQGGGAIEAPMSGVVTRVLAGVGDKVEQGDPILVLTAMKMEHKLGAGISGVVAELRVEAGETVDPGTLLARIEPS